MKFADLRLIEPILRAVSAAGSASLVRSVDPTADKPRPQIGHALFGENGVGRGQFCL